MIHISATPQKAVFSYDGFKRLTAARFDGDTANRYEYFYNATGQVGRALDHLLGREAFSEYDFAGRPRSLRTFQGDDHLYSALLSYDGCDRLSAYGEEIGAGRSKRRTTFTYDNNDRPTAIAYGIDPKTTYTYDKLGRISQRKVYTTASNQYGTAYAYVPGDGTNRTTPLVASITQNGENLAYTYDDAGNILSETRGNVTVSYEYDALGQLTRVNNPNDYTWVYTYDQGGNILTKTRYAYTTGTPGTALETVTYTYGDSNWKDKLTAYNGTPISYDAIGNPTNDGTWTYTWEKGRQLKQMTSTGTTAAFDYNADGLRVRKTVNNVVTNYILHGKNIVHLTQGGDSLHFYYDAQNRPAIVDYNGTLYRYVYNLQGDVLGLLDSNNNEVVQYTYDAWGKILSVTGTLASTVGTVQPFRYRGYVYDVETGFYYLRSRYYHIAWARFLNCDDIIVIYGSCRNNSYAYCDNDPINYTDSNGNNKWLDLGHHYRYRIDNGPNSRHIHIRRPDGKEWKQKDTGEPYEPNHENTLDGDPPSWIKKKLKEKLKKPGEEKDGWDWDANKEEDEKSQENEDNTNEIVRDAGLVILGGGLVYCGYRIIRLLPSLFPPLWWTLPANLAIP